MTELETVSRENIEQNKLEEAKDIQEVNNKSLKLDNDEEITQEDMDDIINFMASADFEKYERQQEIKEALLLLKDKMIEDFNEKKAQLESLRKKEKNNINNLNNEDVRKSMDKEHEEFLQEQKDKFINDLLVENYKDKTLKELTDEEIQDLERNWDASTKIEKGDKIINAKGDKEPVLAPKKHKDKIFRPSQRVYNSLNKLINEKPLTNFGLGNGPKVSVVYDNKLNITKEKSCEMPYLFSIPEV